jgi:hypothetical protein
VSSVIDWRKVDWELVFVLVQAIGVGGFGLFAIVSILLR